MDWQCSHLHDHRVSWARRHLNVQLGCFNQLQLCSHGKQDSRLRQSVARLTGVKCLQVTTQVQAQLASIAWPQLWTQTQDVTLGLQPHRILCLWLQGSNMAVCFLPAPPWGCQPFCMGGPLQPPCGCCCRMTASWRLGHMPAPMESCCDC